MSTHPKHDVKQPRQNREKLVIKDGPFDTDMVFKITSCKDIATYLLLRSFRPGPSI